MFTIGEFSKLSHVSARMLRHYDALGLLRPARVGENGYRYYGREQLEELAQIEQLKGYGFTLAQVAGLLKLPEDELARQLHMRRVRAYGELNDLRQSLRRMEDDMIRMEGIQMLQENYHVILMEMPAQRVYGLRRTINVAQTHELFQELYREMEQKDLRRAGVTQLVYLGEEFHYDAMEVEAQAEAAGDSPEIRELPAQTYVTCTHNGPYETVKYAYDAICAYLGQHPEYEVCGPSVERYLRDEGMARSPEELETAVLFPVRKRA